MAIKSVKANPKAKLTKAQIEMIEKAKKMPVVVDEDSPELTDELSEFRRVSEIRREERRKESVTLRISHKSLTRARSIGKGYTSFLSRLIDLALDDPEMVKKAL